MKAWQERYDLISHFKMKKRNILLPYILQVVYRLETGRVQELVLGRFLSQCRLRCSHSGVAEDSSFLRYNVVQSPKHHLLFATVPPPHPITSHQRDLSDAASHPRRLASSIPLFWCTLASHSTSASCHLRTVFALAKGQTSQDDITAWPLVGVRPLAQHLVNVKKGEIFMYRMFPSNNFGLG